MSSCETVLTVGVGGIEGAATGSGAASDVTTTGVTTAGAATEGAGSGSLTTAFECFAARAPRALAEVVVLAFLTEGTAFADTFGSEGLSFLET